MKRGRGEAPGHGAKSSALARRRRRPGAASRAERAGGRAGGPGRARPPRMEGVARPRPPPASGAARATRRTSWHRQAAPEGLCAFASHGQHPPPPERGAGRAPGARSCRPPCRRLPNTRLHGRRAASSPARRAPCPGAAPLAWPGRLPRGGTKCARRPAVRPTPPPPLVHLAAIPAAAAAARRGESAPRRRRRRPPNFPIAKVDLDDPQSRKKLDLRLERYAHVPSRVLDWPERPRTSRGRRLFEPGLQGARAEREQQSICSTSRRPAQTRAR